MKRSKLLHPQSHIYIAGHGGMVGSAIFRNLIDEGCENIVTRTRNELDLTDQRAVRKFFQNEDIDHVVLAAAKVGGIHANDAYPAEFIRENLIIEVNVIHEAFRAGVKRLLFLGSSCIYPAKAPQPMKEEYLLSGKLEPTNEPYAIAKIAGIKLCESYNRQYGARYRSVMPTNLYGPNDSYDLHSSHVLPALIRKFHLAKLASRRDGTGILKDEARFGPIPREVRMSLGLDSRSPSSKPNVIIWGTGQPRREFLHVDDMAAACIRVMGLPDEVFFSLPGFDPDSEKPGPYESRNPSFVNIGAGKDITIAELAMIIKDVVGFDGEITFDAEKPDGMKRKLLDISRIRSMGWEPTIGLKKGIRRTYEWYIE